MKSMTMKFGVALLATVLLANLGGCASQKFATIDKPITIGDKTYTAIVTERVNPWGTNAVTLNLVESEHKVMTAQQSPCMYPPPPMSQVPMMAPPPPMYYYTPTGPAVAQQQPMVQQQMMMQAPPPVPCPQQPVATMPAPQQPQMCAPMMPMMCYPYQPPCVQTWVELVNTRVVNSNNQGSIGWANGAFQGAVGQAALGGGIAGAGALIRPSRVMGGTGGAGGSASSSSSAAAAAAAASGTPLMR